MILKDKTKKSSPKGKGGPQGRRPDEGFVSQESQLLTHFALFEFSVNNNRPPVPYLFCS
jgi:hypothetical protein